MIDGNKDCQKRRSNEKKKSWSSSYFNWNRYSTCLIFFQHDDEISFGSPVFKIIERKLNPDEIKAYKEKNALLEKMEKEFRQKLLEKGDYYTVWTVINDINQVLGKYKYDKEIWAISTNVRLLFPYQYSNGVGVILIIIGTGILIFSFFPKEVKSKK